MQDYGMFTAAGNALVGGIVSGAITKNLTWPEVYQLLYELSTIEGFGEATDTEVRERVYDACDFDCNFYV